jgi:hypothetical protein
MFIHCVEECLFTLGSSVTGFVNLWLDAFSSYHFIFPHPKFYFTGIKIDLHSKVKAWNYSLCSSIGDQGENIFYSCNLYNLYHRKSWNLTSGVWLLPAKKIMKTTARRKLVFQKKKLITESGLHFFYKNIKGIFFKKI